MQLGPKGAEEDERRITLLMVAGGHFAGMVVGLRPRGKGEKQDVKGANEVRVIKSKTFHRYTSKYLIPSLDSYFPFQSLSARARLSTFS